MLISQPLEPGTVIDEPESPTAVVDHPIWPHRATEVKNHTPKSRLPNARQTPSSPLTTSSTRIVENQSHVLTETIEESDGQNIETSEQCHDDSHQYRSIILKGVAPSTTLADLLSHIRGGQILHCFIRAGSAHVSFVDPIVAEKFIAHCKRADLYIKHKRVRSKPKKYHWYEQLTLSVD